MLPGRSRTDQDEAAGIRKAGLLRICGGCALPGGDYRSESGIMKRVMLIVAYDGTNYCGWQVQNNGDTIEGELNRALSSLLKEEIAVIGASRTDSGVHALGNVAVFDTEARMPAEKMAYALNSRLPDVGETVTLPDGDQGEVHSVNVLRQTVKVLIEVDDGKEMSEYPVSELKFKPKKRKNNNKDNDREIKESREICDSEAEPKERKGEGRENRDNERVSKEHRENRDNERGPKERRENCDNEREPKERRDRREPRERRDNREHRNNRRHNRGEKPEVTRERESE